MASEIEQAMAAMDFMMERIFKPKKRVEYCRCEQTRIDDEFRCLTCGLKLSNDDAMDLLEQEAMRRRGE